MNANEVIARIAKNAGVDVHPNDHVNMSQSSNDTFPTATHVAATEAAVTDLVPALDHLQAALAAKATEWKTVVKSGRTHLMDAVPVTLGQEFGGYARQIEAGIERVEATLPRLGELPIGGTAVGTGLNAPDGFGPKVVAELVKSTGVDALTPAKNTFEAQAARDGLVEASGALRTVAVSLTKIANDIRWMGSGPLTGLGEIAAPRPAARQFDHARQGQSGSAGGGHAGRRPGRRQRRRHRVGRRRRCVRAQRLHPDDGAQPARVVHVAGQRLSAVRRQVRRRTGRATRSTSRRSPSRRRPSSRRSTGRSGTRRRRPSPSRH